MFKIIYYHLIQAFIWCWQFTQHFTYSTFTSVPALPIQGLHLIKIYIFIYYYYYYYYYRHFYGADNLHSALYALYSHQSLPSGFQTKVLIIPEHTYKGRFRQEPINQTTCLWHVGGTKRIQRITHTSTDRTYKLHADSVLVWIPPENSSAAS